MLAVPFLPLLIEPINISFYSNVEYSSVQILVDLLCTAEFLYLLGVAVIGG